MLAVYAQLPTSFIPQKAKKVNPVKFAFSENLPTNLFNGVNPRYFKY